MKTSSDKLITAARKGEQDAIQILLAKGVDIEHRDAEGHTAIHWAAAIGQTNVLQLLIERGGTVNTANIRGYTPLMAACARGVSWVVPILTVHGADVNARASDGTTPLMDASALQADPKIVRTLLESGARVNDVSEHGNTALLRAAKAGRADSVQVLLEYGADPTIANNDGQTPMSLALDKKDWEVYGLLKQAIESHERGEPFRPPARVRSTPSEL